MSGYWRMSLRKADGESLFILACSSETDARALLDDLREETGCDRFYLELAGSDVEAMSHG